MPYLFIGEENVGLVDETGFNEGNSLDKIVLDVHYDYVRWPVHFEEIYDSRVSWEIRASSADPGRNISGVLSRVSDNPNDRICTLTIEINRILIG